MKDKITKMQALAIPETNRFASVKSITGALNSWTRKGHIFLGLMKKEKEKKRFL